MLKENSHASDWIRYRVPVLRLSLFRRGTPLRSVCATQRIPEQRSRMPDMFRDTQHVWPRGNISASCGQGTAQAENFSHCLYPKECEGQ